jgi:hypothetical protein
MYIPTIAPKGSRGFFGWGGRAFLLSANLEFALDVINL